MRTQTLLIAAAATLAAAVTSSQAQTVYSANVVGYVNLTVPGNSFSLIGNQLDTGTNLVNNVLLNGPVSSQTTLFIWTGTTFNEFFYYDTADADPSPAGWYDVNFIACTNTLNPSQAAFLSNPGSTPITITLTGQVDQGTNTYTPVTPGNNFYTEPTALAGQPLDSTNVNFPATSSADTYQSWTGTGYSQLYFYYNSADANPSPAGWYDVNFVPVDSNASVWPGVGQGFLIFHGGGTSNWVQSFEVQ
jgi:hypothetical protein